MKLIFFAISFLIAFLLFAVQPMSTKMVLPVLGGTPAVWNTVMFAFQLLLLGGYFYAHVLTTYLTSRKQWIVHTGMALLACMLLPLSITLETSDAMISNPIPYLVRAFLLQVGLPFFVLSATAPLLQSWVSRSAHPLAKTPYVLYSASNLGSFAGLIGYVLLVEPLFALNEQSYGWSMLYVASMMVLLLLGRMLKPADPAQRVANAAEDSVVTWQHRLVWVGLAFLPSSLNLGVTTYITTDIASIPLLWVIPLSIYLLSYVDAFRSRPILVPIFQRIAPLLGLAAMMLYGLGGHGTHVYLFQLLTFTALAFAIHGWLAARQPAPRYLTQFYVCLSVGGALGGVLNGLIAPSIFREALEYPLVLIVASVTAFILLQRRDDSSVSVSRHGVMLLQTVALVVIAGAIAYLLVGGSTTVLDSQHLINAAGMAGLVSLVIFRRYVRAVYTCVAIACVLVVAVSNGVSEYATLFKDRNFFGMLRVYEDQKTNARYLLHDTTIHGIQSLNLARHLDPQAYYAHVNGIMLHLKDVERKPIASVGLGVGTLKCLARKGQKIDLYEINPMSQAIAENSDLFTYMRDCAGDHRVLLGDARIRLAEQPKEHYGVIIMDAFSSDAIPNHLLTREALEIYFDKLAPEGLLVFHTTNRHIDLWPLLAAQAKALNIVAYGKFLEAPKDEPLRNSSYWVVMAKSPKTLEPFLTDGWKPLVDEGSRPWTDQYVNLLPFFKILR